MSNNEQGMTRQGALRLEFFIIGLGIFALLLIFQPFSLKLFAIGSVLVVIAGLINNLLPMAQPGVRVRSVITIAMVVAMIFNMVSIAMDAEPGALGAGFYTVRLTHCSFPPPFFFSVLSSHSVLGV